jgi:hypothetical protein
MGAAVKLLQLSHNLQFVYTALLAVWKGNKKPMYVM